MMIIIATSLLSYAGFTEETKYSINQIISKDSKTYHFGLQLDSAPISYMDEYGNFTGAKVLVPDEKKLYFTSQNQSQLQELNFGVIKGTTTRILIGSIYSSLTKNFVQLKDEHDAIQKIKDGEINAYFNDER